MSIVIPDGSILSRRINYSCCTADMAHEFRVADKHGEKKCAQEWLYKMKWMQWATGLMNRTPTSTETGCVSHDMACSVIQWADAMCSACECCGDEYHEPCDTVASMEVRRAPDASLQNFLLDPTGGQYLIASDLFSSPNEWADHIGEIATSTGTSWYYFTPQVGTIIYDIYSDSYWMTYSGGVGPLFPVINGFIVSGSLYIISSSLGVNAIGGRQIVVQTSPDQVTWSTVYVGPEEGLLDPTIVANIDDPEFVRTYYYNSECQNGPSEGTIPPSTDPPQELSLQIMGGASPQLWQKAGLDLGSFIEDPNGITFYMNYRINPNGFDGGQMSAFEVLGSPYTGFQVLPWGTGYNLMQFAVIADTGAYEHTKVWSAPGLSDGNWHSFMFTYQPVVSGGVIQSSTVRCWMDGAELTTVTTEINNGDGVYTVPSPTLTTVTIGRAAIEGWDQRICCLYACKSVRSPSDLINYLYPNQIVGNDNTWDRLFYFRPVDPPDTATGSPGVSANDIVIDAVIGVTNNEQFQSDVPPWL